MFNYKELPGLVKILGVDYDIIYCDKPSDVDVFKRESLWGQIDYWTRTIRIYYRPEEHSRKNVWQTIIHEILHGIAQQLHLGEICEDEKTIDLIALGLINVEFEPSK